MAAAAKMRPAILGVLVGGLLWAGALTTPAQAQAASTTSGGITISPPLQQLTLGPGLVQATTDIGLTNNTDKDINATVRVVDFKALDEFGGVSLGQAGVAVSKYGLANWMSLPEGNTLTLPSKHHTSLTVNIDNRADLAPGGHYGAVVINAGTSNGGQGSKVSLKQELVSLIFVTKLGGEHYGLELQSLTASRGSGLPESVNLRFRGTGNVQVVPRGYVTVSYPGGGKMLAKGIINPESTLVLPDTSRQFVTLLQPLAKSALPGSYEITAHYRYDGQANFTTKTIYINQSHLSKTAVFIIILTVVIVPILLHKLHRKSRK